MRGAVPASGCWASPVSVCGGRASSTRTLRRRASRASAWSNARTAAFDAPYAAMPGRLVSAITPEMLTIAPPGCSWGSAARASMMGRNVLVRNSSSIVSIDSSSTLPKATTPAAFITTSSRPCCSVVACTAAAQASGERRSSATRAPGRSSWFSVALLRATNVRSAPRRAASAPIAWPSPPVAPTSSTEAPASGNAVGVSVGTVISAKSIQELP